MQGPHLCQEERAKYIQEIAQLRGQITELETLRHSDKAQIQSAESHCTLAKLMNQDLCEQLDNASKLKARKGLHTGSRLLTAPEFCEEFRARRQEEERRTKEEAATKEAKEAGIHARELERAMNVSTKKFNGAVQNYKKDDLKDLAFALGLDLNGTNLELISHIQEAFKKNPILKADERFCGIYQRKGRNSVNMPANSSQGEN
ncbi:hypothetical protein M422DRAFT_48618 [Sphaerobolus stellatus SS14]|uniref:Unplaced genomic scaffold SPHSTscaffold_62, whole genome shotgun sequence n=1 Tax=Sphaerobolus stellatus (strain SS14) TaxID=990650 RepID=A0A0C9UEB3_SPHS4|nr:hypothetical protein M422DRAFT_48618 [Sphaerobolus stellatus SS14]